MDEIFHPSLRKWISPPVPLETCMNEVKRLVRLKKEELLVIDPTPRPQTPPNCENNSEDDEEPYEPEFMSAEAMKLDDEELLSGSDSEKIGEDVENNKKLKWAKEDETCAAAVAAVGGSDFFVFGKNKKDKKKKKRGRKAKVAIEDSDEDDENDDEDEDYDDDMEEEEPEEGAENSQNDKGLADTSFYERYNDEGVDDQDVELLELSNAIKDLRTADEEEQKQLMQIIPGAVTESDEEDWMDYDNERDNFAGLYQKLDAMQEKDIFGITESDDSGKEDDPSQIVETDDELNNEDNSTVDQDSQQQKKDETVNDGQVPCCSTTIADAKPPPPCPKPQRSSLSKKGGKGKKKSVTINLDNVQNNVIGEDPTATQSQAPASGNVTEDTEQEVPNKMKDHLADQEADFKRFSDWVFNQNNARDTQSKLGLRADLIKNLKLSEDQVRRYQKVTSANLCSVKGEIFQDDPVMQASSMPLLAPPTNREARSSLQSLAIFITHGEDPSVFPWKSINVQQQMNDDFVNHEVLQRLEQQKHDMTNPAMKNQLVNKEEDFLVQLLVYQNTDPDDVLPDEVKLFSEPRLGYELHVLGSQRVRDLMGSFHCENDYVCLKDVPHPDNYKENQNLYAKARYPQAMLLIHDTIYADPNSDVDYVGIINEWAAKPPVKYIGPFKRGDWNTPLKDLTLSFGYPYVYIHLGGCEHVYVFTKSRLLHVEDDHLLKNYPKVIGPTRFKNVYCRVDNEYLARWAVLDFKEFPENPMLLCTECVRMYCYDQKKQKRGDFKLYPFTQLANIL